MKGEDRGRTRSRQQHGAERSRRCSEMEKGREREGDGEREGEGPHLATLWC
jgi:hypothetical protein